MLQRRPKVDEAGADVARHCVVRAHARDREVSLKQCLLALVAVVFVFPLSAGAQEQLAQRPFQVVMDARNAQQSNVPAQAQQAEQAVERAVKRFRIGVSGGVAFDPELIDLRAHGTFAPIFHPQVEFRPGIEIGLGEITTLAGLNLDVLYTLPGATGQTRWIPYIGGGPNFALSHQGVDLIEDDNLVIDEEEHSRFDFGDTDFKAGFNFIAGARNQRGLFFELNATAWGVSNVRLIAGFNF